jgi:uncharacterized Zn finger protein
MSFWTWAPRKTSAQRRAEAARMVQDAARRGAGMSPVAVTGRKIATTFWGRAWCDNLERYRDFAYRLERGRSYLRSGSVIDLRIEAGKIAARVNGSSLYKVAIEISTVGRDAWRAIQRDCAGSIGSRIDLLAGKLSEPVMARLCADGTGLFPAPSAIQFTCSCPDYAAMCKHVAAAMYGVGVRLDHAPELLFTLRRVSLDELVASAVTALPATPSAGRVLAAEGLAAMFGIELADPAPSPAPTASRTARRPDRNSEVAPRPTGSESRQRSGALSLAMPSKRAAEPKRPATPAAERALGAAGVAKRERDSPESLTRFAKRTRGSANGRAQPAGQERTSTQARTRSAKRATEIPQLPGLTRRVRNIARQIAGLARQGTATARAATASAKRTRAETTARPAEPSPRIKRGKRGRSK